jgi:ribosomal protein S18 acetylase RimI-like enzyme
MSEIEVRRATIDDMLDVLAWRNDPVAIAMSKTGAVDETQHRAWFPGAINSPNRVLLIVEEGGKKLGMVRFDRSSDGWITSISLAAEARGRGIGQRALGLAIRTSGCSPLLAEIRDSNIPSIRIFERCGFRQIGSTNSWLRFSRP